MGLGRERRDNSRNNNSINSIEFVIGDLKKVT